MKNETIASIVTVMIYYSLALGFAILTSVIVDGNLMKCIAWSMSIAFLRNLLQIALKQKKEILQEEIRGTNLKNKFLERMDEYQALKNSQQNIAKMEALKRDMDKVGAALARGECGCNHTFTARCPINSKEYRFVCSKCGLERPIINQHD